jgi:hypothetical protein
MTVMCLTTAAGIFVAAVLRGRTRRTAGVAVVILACALLADGWMAPVPARPMPAPVPDPASLQGQIVLQLPIDPYPDIAATWRAVTGGWKSVNGYSGYAPNYYASLALAAKSADGAMFPPFRREGDLHVLVADDATALKAAVERQPGAVRVAQRYGTTQYRLPRQASRAAVTGDRLRIATVQSPCASDTIGRTFDDDEQSLWECGGPSDTQELTIDLGNATAVGSIDYSLGRYSWNMPGELAIDTSVDGTSWIEAYRGSVVGELIEGGLRDARSLRAVLSFPPREARYVRVRPRAQPEQSVWFVAELAVSGPSREP